MKYRKFRNSQDDISLLGMGCMRLPVLRDGRGIDYVQAGEIIDYAYENGINYFDTAYYYHGGESERFIGQALKKYPRNTFYLADKMPGYALKKEGEMERIFDEQLERCQVDFFDFYLCHDVRESSFDKYVNFNVIPFLKKKQKEGFIKRLGFSSHGKPDTLKKTLDLNDWDFVQIQLNYFDWSYQDAKRQYEMITERGIPVTVMEPVRGGRLANLCPEANDVLKSAKPDKSIASWAIRFAASLPGVLTVLSGMSTMEQIIDNIDTMDHFELITPDEQLILDKAVEILKAQTLVPCTACRYCVSECPAGLDIPRLIAMYNDYSVSKKSFGLADIFELPGDKKPDKCLACGLCTGNCPQNIDIPDVMKKLADEVAKL